MEWRSIVIKSQKISQRENSSICLVKDKIYLFGGAIDSVYFNQLFCYDLATQEWLELQTTGQSPCPRESSILKYCQQTNAIYLYGGEQLIDIYVLDLATNSWSFQTTLPLILSDLYSSNEMLLAYPYLYFPSFQHNVTSGVYQYSLPLKQWKFLPFNHILYLDIDNTLIINGYLYIYGQKLMDDYTHKIWRCNLNTNKKWLQLEMIDLRSIKGIEEMNIINLCQYKDKIYLFSQAKTNQVVVITPKRNQYNLCHVSGQVCRLQGSSTCMLGSCLISLKQNQSSTNLLYINLYEEPFISNVICFPIPIEYYPNIRVTINGVVFLASRERLAKNSILFAMLISHNPQEIQLNIMQVSSMAIDKMMANLMQEYFGQRLYRMGNRERYQYFIELAFLAQYFIIGRLTQEVDRRLCDFMQHIDASGTIQTIRLAESLDLSIFAELNASRLIKRYISENRIGELYSLSKSKILHQMIGEYKFDLIHRFSSQSLPNLP